MTGQKEEKKEMEKEEKFLLTDRRTGGPIKGSTRGPADLKTKFNLNSVHYVRLPPTFAFSEIG